MRKPDRIFKDKDGNTYKLFGIRMLKNDYSVVKSWFGCADIASVKLIGNTMNIEFENGVLALNDIEEIAFNSNINSVDSKRQEEAITKQNDTCQRADKDLKEEFKRGYNG